MGIMFSKHQLTEVAEVSLGRSFFFLMVIALVHSQEAFLEFKVAIIFALKLKNLFKSIWL